MKVLLLRTWLTNIGNGFIDMGAKAALEQSIPDAEIVSVSGFGNYTGYHQKLGLLSGVPNIGDSLQVLKDRKSPEKHQMINLSSLVDCDLAVLPGCTLYPGALDPYRHTLEELSDRDIPVLFLGAGGMDYSPKTKSYVKKLFSRINVAGLITRDKDAYRSYADSVPSSSKGIDCAFFIDDYYKPPEARSSFDVYLFDKVEEPAIRSKEKIIRPDHSPMGYSKPYKGAIKQVWSALTAGEQKQDEFRSDVIEDYLFLYSNATETHSDRIHGCVPALVYGNKAQFYYTTPRSGLFESFSSLSEISNKPVCLSEEELESAKEQQIKKIKSTVNTII